MSWLQAALSCAKICKVILHPHWSSFWRFRREASKWLHYLGGENNNDDVVHFAQTINDINTHLHTELSMIIKMLDRLQRNAISSVNFLLIFSIFLSIKTLSSQCHVRTNARPAPSVFIHSIQHFGPLWMTPSMFHNLPSLIAWPPGTFSSYKMNPDSFCPLCRRDTLAFTFINLVALTWFLLYSCVILFNHWNWPWVRLVSSKSIFPPVCLKEIKLKWKKKSLRCFILHFFLKPNWFQVPHFLFHFVICFGDCKCQHDALTL